MIPALPVAHAPGIMVGVIDLRGAVLPIIDLAVRFGLPATTPSSRHAILTVGPEAIRPAPDVVSPLGSRFVRGILALEGRLVSQPTLDAVLPPTAMPSAA